MIRSHDTWVLLLVVSVLSTLLSVIVLTACLWICFKYCINPSMFKGGRQCLPSCKQNFPPTQRDFIELEEFGGGINSIRDPRDPRDPIISKGFSNNKTGASEQLGYRPISNIPVPILPAPKSWTPSPPFRPDTRQQQISHSSMFPGCHNSHSRSKYLCCGCMVHEGCCRVHNRLPSSRMYPVDLGEKLASLQRSSKGLTNRCSRDFSEANQSSYRPPANTSVPGNKQLFTSPILHGLKSSDDDDNDRRRKPGRKLSNINFAHINKSLSHTVASRNKTATESDNYSSNYILTNETEKSNGVGALVIENEASLARTRENTLQGRNSVLMHSTSAGIQNNSNYNHYEQVYPVRKAIKPKSYGRLQRQKRIPKRKRANIPISVYLESPSTESSSEPKSTLNQTSNTYWKIFNPAGDESRKREEEEEEEERYDATPSMSWDHLTPDPSPTQDVQESKVKIDPANTTALFYHEKKLEKDLSCNVENIQINAPYCNSAQT